MVKGYKTYLSAGGIAAITLLHALGYIDDATFQMLLGLLGAGGLAALRAGVGR